MSLESLKLFLKSNKSDQQNPFGKVDPYNTFTFKFTKRPENVDVFDGLAGEDLHKYIKQLTLPNASINGEQINIPGVQFSTHRLMPMGDSGSTIKVEFLNTTKPILESILFEWMKAYTINANDFPEKFKSNIEVGFTHSSQMSDKSNFNSIIDNYAYKYYGVRPIEMTTYNPSNEPMTEFYRSVTFAYDYFWIIKDGSVNNWRPPSSSQTNKEHILALERATGKPSSELWRPPSSSQTNKEHILALERATGVQPTGNQMIITDEELQELLDRLPFDAWPK